MATNQEVEDLYQEIDGAELALCKVGFKGEVEARIRTKPGKRKTAHGGSVKACPRQKRAFRDRNHAKEALVRSRYHNNRVRAEGLDSYRNEHRSYWCTSCRAMHITSKEDLFKETYAQGA